MLEVTVHKYSYPEVLLWRTAVAEIKGKKKRIREERESGKIHETASSQEAKHTEGAQKVQVESEATLGKGKRSPEFQHSLVTGFL